MIWKKHHLFCVFVLALTMTCTVTGIVAQEMTKTQHRVLKVENSDLLETILSRYPAYFENLLKNNRQYRIQIIYSQIDRDTANQPTLRHYQFNLSPALYFYPASTVKLPVAALTLQKLNELNMPGLNRNTTMITEAGSEGQTYVYNDPSSKDGSPTIANYIRKIFLVSDNDAYNRLYEFLGQEYLNEALHALGYTSVELLHRLQLNLTDEQNRLTNPVKFLNPASEFVYEQPLKNSGYVYELREILMGNGYLNGNRRVNQPFDFSKKNRISLADLHGVLQSIVLPETVPLHQRFNLKDEDYNFLYKCMSMKPAESSFPQYDPEEYPDSYVKFLLFGGKGKWKNENIRIFNKVGDAYGFLQDIAYIVDFKKGVEFMLSASIYCNSDGIFNDDNYDYDTVGFPFMKHLGEVIYEYEKNRPKKIKPDLSKFKFNYKDDSN